LSGRRRLYQLALVTTYARGCRGFATPVQALDSTRIYDAITPHNIRDMSQDFRVWVLLIQINASVLLLRIVLSAC
jgi:hypothetical protein